MQKIFTLVVLMMVSLTTAQFKGSGNTITKTFDYKNFDKIYFKDLDGNLEVEIGKTWSISVTIDDNLESLLAFKENPSEHALTIYFKGNNNNKMYIEDTNVKIKITMPEASVIGNYSNAKLEVKGVFGRYFRLENKSNGSTKISGTIDELDVKNFSNGNANLSELKAKTGKITCGGNGNVTVTIDKSIIGIVSGNGNITNKGKANFDNKSSRSGNGNLIFENKN